MVWAAVAVLLNPAVNALAATRPSRAVAARVPSGQLAGLRFYLVAPGDTVASVAARFGVSPDALRAANGITGRVLYLGARILLDAPNGSAPVPGMAGAASAPSTSGTYTVKRGDSFARIAKRAGTTVASLLALNGKTVHSLLIPGQTIRISAASPPAGGSPAAAPAAVGTYKVKKGDSFARIAKRSGSTVAKLLAMNLLKRNHVLQPGQLLWVPIAGAPATSAATRGAGSGARSLACPVPGALFNYDWGFPREGGRYHEGLDMFAPANTPIRAPVDGTVSVGTSSVSGHFWNLTGVDGWSYFGAHMVRFAKTGRVKAGDIIGYVGNTGDAAGGPTHLHFQMRPSNGRPVNPYPYMSVACHS
jgi:murein DD-endopeptidase MepM/ murein hydrolase activator NlpD